jgi:hypothetical protein
VIVCGACELWCECMEPVCVVVSVCFYVCLVNVCECGVVPVCVVWCVNGGVCVWCGVCVVFV